MQSITIKVPEQMAKEIDKAVKSDYGTKTEFIREAIRIKLEKAREEKLLKHFKKFYGSSKKKVSDEELRITREKLSKEYLERLGFK
ncbi:ribbon-helix-helix domain-containing protein [Candidatus Woesearchaeota archaeon]|nr:ribbon-helix-helix domain-containing protein [Candidatus Woesearchaeota archaeon]